MGRDPAGGFYFLVTDTLGANPRLYHAGETASGLAALEHVPTEPSLGEVRVARGTGVPGGSQHFGNCTMAVASNGDDYIQTLQEAWRVAR